jgi:hypothetical protein
MIRVRGTARPGAHIISILANGVPAETQDGFASWSAQVPLELGANTIESSRPSSGRRRNR